MLLVNTREFRSFTSCASSVDGSVLTAITSGEAFGSWTVFPVDAAVVVGAAVVGAAVVDGAFVVVVALVVVSSWSWSLRLQGRASGPPRRFRPPSPTRRGESTGFSTCAAS